MVILPAAGKFLLSFVSCVPPAKSLGGATRRQGLGKSDARGRPNCGAHGLQPVAGHPLMLLSLLSCGPPALVCALQILSFRSFFSAAPGLSCSVSYFSKRLARFGDQSALANAAAILAQNGLETQVQLRLQRDPSRILRGVLGREETIAFCVCNPPFHESLQYARRSAGSKWRGLGKEDEQGVEKNYQGQATELCCEGGEVGFVTRMAEESSRPRFRQACIWFSALLSRESSVEPVKQRLGELGARRRVFELCQGRNVKWVIAWTFIDRSVRDVQLRLVTASPGSCAEPSEDGGKRRKKRQIVAATESPEE
ncbi:unnamed protein product, partial [Polarella glacialis]